MIIHPSSPPPPFTLQDSLDKFTKRAPKEIISLALQKIPFIKEERFLITPSFFEENPLIQELFKKLLGPEKEESDLQARQRGFESALDLIENYLTHTLWNRIDEEGSLNRAYDSLTTLLFTPLSEPLSFEEEVLNHSVIQSLFQKQESEEISDFDYLKEKVESRFQEFSNLLKREEQILQEIQQEEEALKKIEDLWNRARETPKAFYFAKILSAHTLKKSPPSKIITSLDSLSQKQNPQKNETNSHSLTVSESLAAIKASLIFKKEHIKTLKKELPSLKENWNKFQKRVEEYPEAQLFPKDPQERKKAYQTFAYRIGIAFRALSSKDEDLLLFSRIPEFIDQCFKAWDEHSLQLKAYAVGSDLNKTPIGFVWSLFLSIRRSAVEKALQKSFKESAGDVHYQNAARNAANELLKLGYSKEELGFFEPLLVTLVSRLVLEKATDHLQEKGKEELIEQISLQMKSFTEEEKTTLFAEIVSRYPKAVEKEPNLWLDPCLTLPEKLEELSAWAVSENPLSELHSILNTLKETGVSLPLSLLSPTEKAFEKIKKSSLYRKNIEKFLGIRAKKEAFALFRSLYEKLPREQEEEISLLLKELEEAETQEKAFLKDVRKQVLSYLEKNSFEKLRKEINQVLLAEKLTEEETFGAYALAIQAKALRLEGNPDALNTRILHWIQTLPFSEAQERQIFAHLEKTVKSVENPDWKKKLEQAIQIKNMDALIQISEEKPLSLKSLEEILCFGTEAQVQSYFQEHPIAEEEREQIITILARRGHLAMVMQLLEGHDDLRGIAVANAAYQGHLDIVRELLKAPYKISEAKRGFAVQNAASKGHLPIVQELLKPPHTISEEKRGISVGNAALQGHLAIVQELLKPPHTISEEKRGIAVGNAALNGHLAIVQELLKHPHTISEENRGFAVLNAALNGHLAIVQELLKPPHTISEEKRGIAVGNAAHQGHLAIVQELLIAPHTISEKKRGIAAGNAALNGHLPIVQKLLKHPYTISIYAREKAIQNSSNDQIILVLISSLFRKPTEITEIIQNYFWSLKDEAEYLKKIALTQIKDPEKRSRLEKKIQMLIDLS